MNEYLVAEEQAVLDEHVAVPEVVTN